ncbi:DUF7697 family protein [Magnetococcus sp. PR-3]|uniref:DUF7697 family protein n=1 Tax=Magnetococcus sp. PR-3 TaxID=3120355 RepID=UPI003FA582BC
MQACQNQLRLAPSGQILGIDMNVALQMARSVGLDEWTATELLPVAESGLIEANLSEEP